METRHFALQDWVDRDLLTLKRITTSDNHSDAMTKPLARTLFYRHMDFIQGKLTPKYAYAYQKWKCTIQRQDIEITPEIKKMYFKQHSIHKVCSDDVQNRGGSCIECHSEPLYKEFLPLLRDRPLIHNKYNRG